MLVAAGVVAVMAVISERLVLHPLRKASGIRHDCRDWRAAVSGSRRPSHLGCRLQRMQTPYTSIIDLGGITAPAQRLLIIAAAFALMVALHLFLTRTVMGSTIIAMAQNRDGASIVGVMPTASPC